MKDLLNCLHYPLRLHILRSAITRVSHYSKDICTIGDEEQVPQGGINISIYTKDVMETAILPENFIFNRNP